MLWGCPQGTRKYFDLGLSYRHSNTLTPSTQRLGGLLLVLQQEPRHPLLWEHWDVWAPCSQAGDADSKPEATSFLCPHIHWHSHGTDRDRQTDTQTLRHSWMSAGSGQHLPQPALNSSPQTGAHCLLGSALGFKAEEEEQKQTYLVKL